MPDFIPYVAASCVLGFFGWLRYREYMKFMAKLVEKHGVEGLRAADKVAKPGLNVEADLPHKEAAAYELRRRPRSVRRQMVMPCGP